MSLQDLKIDRTAARRAPARRSRRPWFGRSIVLLGAGGAVWLFWAPITGAIDRFRLPTVSVARVAVSHPATAAAVQGTAANGHIVASRRAALSADTPGRIVELNVTEGSLVKKGDVVARLYAEEYAAVLRRAEAELDTTKARARSAEAAIEAARAELAQHQKAVEAAAESVAEAVANLALAQQEFERAKDLLDRGISSKSAFDTAKAELDTSSAQLRGAEARHRATDAAVALAESRITVARVDAEAARAGIEVSQAARQLAAATLAKTEVKAPFDGIVVLKDAEVGEVVSPNSQGGSNARGSVCTMVDLDSLEAQAEVQETSMAAVEVGAPATVFLDAYPDQPYRGVVDRIWPTANRQKATIEVRIKFDQPDAQLRPEMGVRVVFGAIPTEASAGDTVREPAILVPEGAVVELAGDRGVFLLERDAVRFAPVELGERRAGRVSVRSGLQAGQLIVLDPPLTLNSGDRVRVQS